MTTLDKQITKENLDKRYFPKTKKVSIQPLIDVTLKMSDKEADAILSKKAQGNGCLSFFIGVLPFFAARVKPAPLCVCLEYIHDNGDCPVHGKSPYGGK